LDVTSVPGVTLRIDDCPDGIDGFLMCGGLRANRRAQEKQRNY